MKLSVNWLEKPLKDVRKEIYEQAEHLRLFTVTLGESTSRKIDTLFQTNDFALGCMLDAAASVTADRAKNTVRRDSAVALDIVGGI